MSESIFRIRDLQKCYEGDCVLQVDHLDIHESELFTIVGPSGAGKSTLLRLLNFLEPPTVGEIFYKQHEFSASQEIPISLQREVTTVFQTPLLLNRSVMANVQYGLKLRRIDNSNKYIQEVLDKVGLLDFTRRRPRSLSGGEAQRVALARAMVIEPKVLLLDEPTANLDPYNVGLIEDIIRDLNQNSGTTIILVTHNVFQARRLAQRVAFLLNGKIIEVSEVNKFFDRPSDTRTAAFVAGEMVY